MSNQIASEYILSLFYPDDLIAVMTKRQGEKPIHSFAKASAVAAHPFLASLRKQNDAGADIYICMNPLSAERRTKENVSAIRTAYLDIDKNGAAALDKISQSTLVPAPHFILQSSPNKFQVIWGVKGIAPAEQEQLLVGLIQEFGGDPAAKDCSRVLRLPGFINHKYDTKPVVAIFKTNFNGEECTAKDFRVKIAPFKPAKKTPRVIAPGERNKELTSLAGKLRRDGFEENEILATLQVANRRCSVPLSDAEVATIAGSVSKYNPAPKNPTDNPRNTPGTSPTSEIISVMACDVVPVPIQFLWEPYLQTDALNAYYGNPSVGKGHIAMDNIACLTTGRPFPSESSTDRKPMNCVILAAEEGVADTIVPRLTAARADLTRVRIVRSIRYHGKGDNSEDRLITFQTDMAALKADLRKHPEENFLLVDPITNYVGDINFNQDGEVRPVLTLLVQLAEELKITVLIVGHFNKNTNVGSALDKPGGGRAWTAVPRSVWGFFRGRDNKQQRVMVNLKLNNAKETDTGLLFTIDDRVIGTKPNGKPWSVGHVEWGDKTDMSADEMVAAEHPEARRDSKGTDFLNASLKHEVRKATDVYTEAEDASIHQRTLKRACADIGVLKFKMHDGWYWQHPSDQAHIPDSARELNKEAQARRETQKPWEPESAPVPQDEPAFNFTEVRVG